MSKAKISYTCQSCGAQYAKWMGQCASCQEWSTLQEKIQLVKSTNARQASYAGKQANQIMSMAEIDCVAQARMPSGLKELDRVLGGGIVAGSVVLLGGDPGIGKSTILLQALQALGQQQKALYITGEESLAQVASRAQRLGLADQALRLLAETQIERVLVQLQQEQPQIVVIDSIQTMFTDLVSSAPGSVSQVRESAAQLVRYAKQHNVAMLIVGHVTKEGALAGPRVLEHMVDTVLYFEGEKNSRFRAIRAVKNRFGAVNELGIFAMTERGLREVSNPSAIFLSPDQVPVSGSVITAIWEGSRPLLIEVQALVDTSHLANPRRVAVGFDSNRLAMLLAVLHRHAGIATYDQDVFINVVGGLRVSETAIDLAVLLAIYSSLRDQILPRDLLVLGEIGLGGELRPVSSSIERLKEASKHGFKQAIIPASNRVKKLGFDIIVQMPRDLRAALQLVK